MSLTEMSFFGGVMILAVAAVRTLALHRLPKRVFCILWGIVVLRLLMPFSIPSPLSVYTLADPSELAETVMPARRPAEPLAAAVPAAPAAAAPISTDTDQTTGLQIPVWQVIWGTGTLLCTAFFTISYIQGRRKFSDAIPAEEAAVWLTAHSLQRPLAVRQSEAVSTPLTYGILRPVILVPLGMDWTDTEQTAYVLEHEYVHVQRFDAAAKLALAAALSVHWFNPLVWGMYVLANRDIELSCDEAVVKRFGVGKRSAYAMTLIGMEEKRSSQPPLANCFSKNAIEERIRAIMKLKKTSVLTLLVAAFLVCGISVGFATTEPETENLRGVLNKLPDPDFTVDESRRLLSLWFEGYENMTVSAYQQKIWTEWDSPEDRELLERYSQSEEQTTSAYFDDQKANRAAAAFREYYFNVCEPLTAERWESRVFSGDDFSNLALGAGLEYDYVLNILDAEQLTVGEYERTIQVVKTAVTALLADRTAEERKDSVYMESFLEQEVKALENRLSTSSLQVQIGYSFRPMDEESASDEAFYRQTSESIKQQWDELLSPYTEFGLTYEFDDPDNDGNGLRMYYQGREVRGITDGNTWITEHSGISTFSSEAVDLYAVYGNGKRTGLRLATAEEQAEMDAIRKQNTALGAYVQTEEPREFPNGTEEDYASFLELMRWEAESEYASRPHRDYQDMTLSEFNMRLLEWANANTDAYNRIMCDEAFHDYAVTLSEEEKRFVTLTSSLSGTENGMYVRSNYTGQPEEDPDFSVQLPDWMRVESSITVAWVELYYRCSYHISDKSMVTVRERDNCVGGMMAGVEEFWMETDLDTLLRMTEAQVIERLNQIAAEHSTEQVTIHPLTAEDVHFEAVNESGRN